MDDAAFGRATDAFLFFLQTSRQDHIRVMCGLRHKKIDDAEEFELLQGLHCELGIRKGNKWIEAGGQQCLDLSTMNRFHDLYGGITCLRNLFGSNSPDLCRVCAGFRVADGSLTGKLVAFLAVFAATLPIPLPGDHRAASAFPTNISGCKAQVNQRRTVFDAFGLVLDTTCVKDDGTFGPRKEARRSHNGLGWHSGLFRNSAWVPDASRFGNLFEANRMGQNEISPLQPVAQDDVKQTHVQSEVGARPNGKIHVRIAADRRHRRIDDDEFSASVAAPPQIIGSDRGALRNIRACHEHDLCFRDIAPRKRTAVHAKRQFVSRTRRNHTQSSVVIDVAGTQCNASKFSKEVGFLGNQGSSAVDGHGILTIFLLNLPQASRRKVQCFIPRRNPKSLRRAYPGIVQPVRMATLHVALNTLWTEHSAVERELFPGLKASHLIAANLKLYAALLAAKTAMRFHQTLRGLA